MFDINNYIDKNYKLSKSYIDDKGFFKTSRCRIEPELFSNLVYDYIFSNINETILSEKYLEISRMMNKKEKDYKKSNNMDTNSIFRLLKIKKRNQIKINDFYLYDDVKNDINNYINYVMNSSVNKNTNFYIKWNNYINRRSISFKNIKQDIKKYKLEILDSCNIFQEIENNFHSVDDNIYYLESNFKQDEKILETIGLKGEEIIYEYLKKIFNNVEHISKIHKYYPYDFLINNIDEKIYIEVKTTIDPVKSNFIMSRNEYNFYKKNKENYWLILVRNLNPYNKNSDIVPFINVIKKPNIIVNDKIVGFKNNSIYISPHNYSNF